MEERLVRVFASVPSRDTEVQGVLGMVVRKDDATDTHLGFMPALKLYSQGRTPQEAERLMEKAAALYLETAVREGQLSDILLARGFRRIIPGSGGEKPVDILSIRSISGLPKSAGAASEMELEFAGAN